jgi:MoxR-like ATPase
MDDRQAAQALVGEAEQAGETLARVRAEIGKAVFGQERVIELTLAAVLAGGHVLLVGAPGLAKTRLVEAMARVLGLDWARVQFTPDLMPADILGSEVLDQDEAGRRHFRFVKGPIFTQLLMAADHPGNQIAAQVLTELFGKEPYHVYVGGSIPISTFFLNHLGAYMVNFGWTVQDENLHAPNEFFRLENFRRGPVGYCQILKQLVDYR